MATRVQFAQISDLHIGVPGGTTDARYAAAEHLRRAVEHLCSIRPHLDAVVCTGDLVDEGRPEEYRRLVELLSPIGARCYVIPGNHDDRERMREAFSDRGYLPAEGFLQYAADLGPLRLLALDTLVPGAPGGRLCN